MSGIKSKVAVAVILALSIPGLAECTGTFTCATCTIASASGGGPISSAR